jgi:multidrug transporter EmrE-like cation transporter
MSDNKQIDIVLLSMGIFLKIIDDHFDNKLYDNVLITIIKILLLYIIVYICYYDANFTLIGFLICIGPLICIEQMYNDNNEIMWYYWIIVFIIFSFFTYNVATNKYTNVLNTIHIYDILGGCSIILGIIIEHKLFTEEYSTNKIMSRIIILIYCIYVYMYGVPFKKYMTTMINQFSKSISIICGGYMIASIVNMSYLYYNTRILKKVY